ncbi:MAG: TlpA disulfide reductase family protein [Candidatus Diapherotrites archaeon]|nr:TlpA disulfide reductase family protein [Candidatus Diapherotrites archaeon]
MNNEHRILSVEAKRFILLLFVSGFWILDSGFSQNIIIKGKIDTTYLSSANTIYVFTYEDYISYKEKELANSKFDEKGNFNLSFSVSVPTYIFLMVDNAKAEMVAEPDKMYDINFLAKDSDAVNTLSVAVPVEIEFNNSNETELNFLIADFMSRYEAFLEYHRPLIAKKNSSIFGKIDTMKTLCKQKYSTYSNSYLNNHIKYTFASLEENIALKGTEKVFQNYVNGKPIQLSNYDYMSFFNQFFSATVSTLLSNSKMQNEIGKQSFSSLMEYFKQNKFLVNDTICEAVILKSLAEYFRYPSIKVNSVLAILDQASKQCKTEENRRSAENLIKKLSVMNVGKPAPALSFQDVNGKTVSLSDFKGKYIYLNFWATWCSSCTQEMMLIPELKKIHGTKITFVSISVDKNPDAMKNFLKKNSKLDWTFLYCDNYKKAKEEFNVLTVPTYYLIDPKGNILKSPADKPQDIEPTFIQIKKKK